MKITLQDKLYELRRDKGWSQEELAELLDVSRQAVSKWERGEASPDTNNLIKIARLYNVPMEDFAKCINGESLRISVTFEDESAPVDDDPLPKKRGISLKKPACAENAGTANDFIRMPMPENAADNNGEIYPQSKPSDPSPIGDGSAQSAPSYGNAGFDMGSGSETSYSGSAYGGSPSDEQTSGKKKKKGRLRAAIASMASAPDPQRAATAAKFKKFPFWALMLLFFFFFGGVFDLWECSWLFFLLIPVYYSAIKAYERKNLNYFCYPLIATAAFFGFSFLEDFLFYSSGDLWTINAFVWFLSIPLYYTAIAAYRKKNCRYFCFPVLVLMVWLVFGVIYDEFFEFFLWLFALIPFYYIYSYKLDKMLFGKRK